MQVITPYQRSPHWLLSIVMLLLIGCATVSKLDVSRVNSLATPNEVARQPDSAIGKTVQWGGEIIAVINRQDSTEVQVLAYPLYSDGSPNRELDPTGRFLVVYRGYLEPSSFICGLNIIGAPPIPSLGSGSALVLDFSARLQIPIRSLAWGHFSSNVRLKTSLTVINPL